MSEPLIHWSAKPLTSVLSVQQAAHRDKPFGLWVSAGDGDDGWFDFCVDNDYHLDGLAYASEIILEPDTNVLRLTTAGELDDFSSHFAGPIPDYMHRWWKQGEAGYSIDWPRVAGAYQGIIIAPYCWERRMTRSTHWYYTWDCASGCIWDATAIAKVGAAPANIRRNIPATSVSARLETGENGSEK